MGMFDDAVKKAVPGGNLTKPLVIAAGALILGKLLGGGKTASAPTPQPAPQAAPTAAGADGGLLGGLGSLIEKFQNAGHGETVDSWVGTGPNKPIQPGQLQNTLGNDTLSNLAAQAGISKEDLLAQLAQALPAIIDKLTPNGRLPTQAEVSGYRGR
jgi:uncharacterized protein YidB (DUF937 family)